MLFSHSSPLSLSLSSSLPLFSLRVPSTQDELEVALVEELDQRKARVQQLAAMLKAAKHDVVSLEVRLRRRHWRDAVKL
jgi:hypothetical protein